MIRKILGSNITTSTDNVNHQENYIRAQMESQVPTFLVGQMDMSSSRDKYLKQMSEQESDLVGFEDPDFDKLEADFQKSLQGLTRAEIRKLELSKRYPVYHGARDQAEHQRTTNLPLPKPGRQAPLPPRIEKTVNAYSAAYDEALKHFSETVPVVTEAPKPLFKREQTKKVSFEEEMRIQEEFGHKVKQRGVSKPMYNMPDFSNGDNNDHSTWNSKQSDFKKLKPTIRATMDSNMDLKEMQRWRLDTDYEPLPTRPRDVTEKDPRYTIEGTYTDIESSEAHQDYPYIAGIQLNDNPITDHDDSNVAFSEYEPIGDTTVRIGKMYQERKYREAEYELPENDSNGVTFNPSLRGLKQGESRAVIHGTPIIPVESGISFGTNIRGLVEKEPRKLTDQQPKYSDRELPKRDEINIRGLQIKEGRKTATNEDRQHNFEYGTEIRQEPRLVLNKDNKKIEQINEYPEAFGSQLPTQGYAGKRRSEKFVEQQFLRNEPSVPEAADLTRNFGKTRYVKEGNRCHQSLEYQSVPTVEYGSVIQPTVRGGVYKENTIHNRQVDNDVSLVHAENNTSAGTIRINELLSGKQRHESERENGGLEYQGPMVSRKTAHYFKQGPGRAKTMIENPTVEGLNEPQPENRKLRPQLGRMTLEANRVAPTPKESTFGNSISRRSDKSMKNQREMNKPQESEITVEPKQKTSQRRVASRISSVNSTPLQTPDWRTPFVDNRTEAEYIAKHMDLPNPY